MADAMIKEATPKKVAFVSKPYTQEERIQKEEQELEQLLKEQKGEVETKAEESEDTSEEEPTSAEEKTFKKRYGDLRRHTQEKEREFQKQLNDLKEQLDKATKKEMKLPKSDEDIEAWAKDYPDVAKIVETIAMKKAREQSAEIETRLQKIDEMSAEAQKDKAEAELMRLHPDFDSIRDSDDFHDWAEEQPKWVQDALYENDNDARSAARAIDLYKADRNINKSTKTKSDKGAAMDVGTKTTKTKVDAAESGKKILESTVQKMSATQYEKQADAIMEAIRSGNFIYDISGSAR
jgi:chromosome segregation ATPase